MKIFKLCFSICLLCLAFNIAATEQALDNKISDDLNEALTTNDSFIDVNIHLIGYPQGELIKMVQDMKNSEKRHFVRNELTAFNDESQKEVISILENNSDKVVNYNSYWIANVITARISRELIPELALVDNVFMLDHDKVKKMLVDPVSRDNEAQNTTERDIAQNVLDVQADMVWSDGYQGSGIIVAVLDTGVNYNHNDLAGNMWTDTQFPYHGYDFAYDDNNPMDGDGHGTHCAGTIAGQGASGTQTGVAPQATIMALKVLLDDGDGQESSVWSAAQFAIDHGANVLSISLGWMHMHNPAYSTWRSTFETVQAAGVVAMVAAGNEGDYGWLQPPRNVGTPGNCPPPWLHPDQTLTGGTSGVISIGASDGTSSVASFSSRGPCMWSDVSPYNDYPYNPEMGLIRPDVCAPGVGITSLDYSDASGYEYGWDGTSMATPCTAGIAALMLSKNPDLSPAEIDQILETTATPLVQGKNSNSGSGIVNAYLAVQTVSLPNTPPDQTLNPVPADAAINVGTTPELRWERPSGTRHYKLYFGTDNPPTNMVFADSINTTSYLLDSLLTFSTTYYWRVDAVNSYAETPGNVWSFTTGAEPDIDFEEGHFVDYQWFNQTLYLWNFNQQQAYNGSYSLKSGGVPDNQSSELLMTLNVLEDGNISFYRKVSCADSDNDDGDYLSFSIDDTEMGRWDGEEDWDIVTYPVTAGQHSFTWIYQKNASSSSGSDCGWIDYIMLPPHARKLKCLNYSVENINELSVSWENPYVSTGTYLGCRIFKNDEDYAFISYDSPSVFTDTGIDRGDTEYTMRAEYQNNIFRDIDFTVSVDFEDPYNLMGNHVIHNDFEFTWSYDFPSDRSFSQFELFMDDEVIATTVDTSVVVSDLTAGEHLFKVRADYDGAYSDFSDEYLLFIISNDETDAPELLPTGINSIYPSPFNPETTISFSLEKESQAEVSVYNVKGEKVTTLSKGVLDAGSHNIKWTGTNRTGNAVSSGVYFFVLKTNKSQDVKKAILLK